MKKILAILLSLLTLLSCGFLSACSAEKTQPDTPDTETVWEMVSEAYIYAFPLVLTDATKTLSTNTETSPITAANRHFNKSPAE